MSLPTLLPWLLIMVLMSVFGVVYGVSRVNPIITLLGAIFFTVFITALTYKENARYWRSHDEDWPLDLASLVARRNARLFTTLYVWGGMAMMAIYSLTQLHWRHGLQYAAGMLLLGAVSLVFALRLGRSSQDEARRKIIQRGAMLTLLQGIAAIGGLIFLLASGKLSSEGPDWAANYIFLTGGIAIVLMSAITLRATRALKSESDSKKSDI